MQADSGYQITGSNVPVYTRKGPDGLEVWFIVLGRSNRIVEGETIYPVALPSSIPSKVFTSSAESISLSQTQRRQIGFREAGRYNVYISEDERAFSLIRTDLDVTPRGPAVVIESIQMPETLDFRA